MQFLIAHVEAVRAAEEAVRGERRLRAFCRFLEEELTRVALAPDGSLAGQPHKFQNLASDEMSWLAPPGNALFSAEPLRLPTGEQEQLRVTLRLLLQRDNTSDLGLSRVPPVDDTRELRWVPLFRDVDELEIRYFDARQNAWVEKWADPGAMPAVVRFRIRMAARSQAFEYAVSLPPVARVAGEAQ